MITKNLSVFCDEWLLLKRNQVKGSTLVKYITNIENHIKPYLGKYKVSALTTLIVEDFSHHLLYNDNLSTKTVRDILSQLKAILKYAAKQIPNITEIDIIYPKEMKSDIRILTKNEQKILTEYLMNEMDECKFGVLLSLSTGLRIGEICALRWQDISIKDMTLRVGSTMQRLKSLNKKEGNKTTVIISDPKSNHSARIIPLTVSLTEMCKQRKTDNPSDFVLTGRDDFYIEPRTLQYRFAKYTKECGLEGVHFHSLRHTFATRCVEVGFEIKSLSEVLGHASPKITLERYVHSSIELKRDNMNKLAVLGY